MRRVRQLHLKPELVSDTSLVLTGRRRATVQRVLVLGLLPTFLIIIAVGSASGWGDTPSPATSTQLARRAFQDGLVMGLLGALLIAVTLVAAHLDKRMARTLPTRVTRSEAVTLSTVLGPARLAALILILGTRATVLFGLILTPSIPAAYPAGYGVANGLWLLAGLVAVSTAIRRPTIAVDSSGLHVDERLRANDLWELLAPAMVWFDWSVLLFGIASVPRPKWLTALMWCSALTGGALCIAGFYLAPWRPYLRASYWTEPLDGS